MNQMSRDLWMILPQLIVLATGIISLIMEIIKKPKYSCWTVVSGMSVAAVSCIIRIDGISSSVFDGTFRVDAFNHWAVIILAMAAILCSLLMRRELAGSPREGTAYSLLAFSTLGSMLLAGSGDVMFLVLGVLMNSLGGFALAAFSGTSKATEGAMKYFIYGSVTGAVMLFGLTYWAGLTGGTLLIGLSAPDLPALGVILGFVGVVAGLGYTASLFPFHFWTPDTFEGAPVSVAAYLSVTPKIGAFFALARVMENLSPEIARWGSAWVLISILSMTYGNIVALKQKNIIRLLAYSTIAQAGYFILGIIGGNESRLGHSALVVFSLAYAVMNIGAFAIVQHVGTQVQDFHGLVKRNKLLAISMTIFLLSLTGIPPLAGFAGKFLLIGSSMQAGYTLLAVAAIINSVISLGVYLRIIHPIFFKNSASETKKVPALISVVILLCLTITLIGGIGMKWFL